MCVPQPFNLWPQKKSSGCAWLAGCFLAAGCLYAQSLSPNTNLTAREEQIIAAAKAGAAPRFNGARIVGIRPGTPFIHSLAVTGERPITFSAKKLPAGLSLDPNTGIITGSLDKGRGIHRQGRRQKFRRQSQNGNQNRLRRHAGPHAADGLEQLRCFRRQRHRVRSPGECALRGGEAAAGRLGYGRRGLLLVRPRRARQQPQCPRQCAAGRWTNFGRLLPATNRFPSAVDGAGFKPLADAVHALGLKFGIHIMRGIPRNSVKATCPSKVRTSPLPMPATPTANASGVLTCLA